MRGRWILDRKTGKLVPADEYRREAPTGPIVIKDIEPYRNVIDRKVIGGRRQHREFLRQHGVHEIGNEKPVQRARELPAVAPDIKRAIEQLKSR